MKIKSFVSAIILSSLVATHLVEATEVSDGAIGPILILKALVFTSATVTDFGVVANDPDAAETNTLALRQLVSPVENGGFLETLRTPV